MTRRKRPHSEKRKRRRPPTVKRKAAEPAKRDKGREVASHVDLTGDLPVWMDDELPMWSDEHGMHAMVPGIPDPKTFEQLTQLYQQKIRNSSLWDEMVREFGLEKAEQLLKEFRAQPG